MAQQLADDARNECSLALQLLARWDRSDPRERIEHVELLVNRLPGIIERAAVYRVLASGVRLRAAYYAFNPQWFKDRDDALKAIRRAIQQFKRVLRRSGFDGVDEVWAGPLETEYRKLVEPRAEGQWTERARRFCALGSRLYGVGMELSRRFGDRAPHLEIRCQELYATGIGGFSVLRRGEARDANQTVMSFMTINRLKLGWVAGGPGRPSGVWKAQTASRLGELGVPWDDREPLLSAAGVTGRTPRKAAQPRVSRTQKRAARKRKK